MLVDLHMHLAGSIPPSAVLDEIVRRWHQVRWDWYDEQMSAAYGFVPPIRAAAERYQEGDESAGEEFARLFIFADADGGAFSRFQAKSYLFWAVCARDDEPRERRRQTLHYASVLRRFQLATRVSYCEVRMDVDSAELLLPVYAQGCPGLVERAAVTLSRTDPWEDWPAVQRLALSEVGHVLTGIDFCGIEEGHPPKETADFLAAVRAFNEAHPSRALAVLYHVGESYTDKSLESAARWVHEAAELGAHRLGHAIALGTDPADHGTPMRTETVSERRDQIAYDLRHQHGLAAVGVRVDTAALHDELAKLALRDPAELIQITYDAAAHEQVRRRQAFALEQIRSTGSVIEVCPTSNRRIAGLVDPRQHPVHRFLEADVPVAVCTDDAGIFGVTLDAELDWVANQYSAPGDVRARLVANAGAGRSEVLTGRETV